jgi:hypothetical protein
VTWSVGFTPAADRDLAGLEKKRPVRAIACELAIIACFTGWKQIVCLYRS